VGLSCLVFLADNPLGLNAAFNDRKPRESSQLYPRRRRARTNVAGSLRGSPFPLLAGPSQRL